jgi:uncharacterized membrane protein YgdD (TMEM256/DUF423 family)
MMNQKQTLTTAAILGALGVAIGAFGAHTLKAELVAAGRFDAFETAVRYQFYHVFALLITGVLMGQFTTKKLSYASLSFVIGILLFSGSLYGLCLTGIKAFGPVTPVGGIFFILGWMFLVLGVRDK